MKIVKTVKGMQKEARELKSKRRTIAFVPTMGALHPGHLALVRLARQKADVVVLSIFVNPKQFGPKEDFSRYPRPLAKDCELCRKAGVDIVFTPSAEDLYPPDFSTYVTEEKLSAGLCGRFRPGHFRGVATVVLKLFNIVMPDLAVFGRKDYQQLQVLRKMAADLNLNVKIVAAETVRESSGLALSSRNKYLFPADRARASGISEALRKAAAAVKKRKRDCAALKKLIKDELQSTVRPTRIDYIEIVDAQTLETLKTVDRPAIALVALWLDQTRLIDNAELNA